MHNSNLLVFTRSLNQNQSVQSRVFSCFHSLGELELVGAAIQIARIQLFPVAQSIAELESVSAVMQFARIQLLSLDR